LAEENSIKLDIGRVEPYDYEKIGKELKYGEDVSSDGASLVTWKVKSDASYGDVVIKDQPYLCIGQGKYWRILVSPMEAFILKNMLESFIKEEQR
jgi:hypothetical protein